MPRVNVENERWRWLRRLGICVGASLASCSVSRERDTPLYMVGPFASLRGMDSFNGTHAMQFD